MLTTEQLLFPSAEDITEACEAILRWLEDEDAPESLLEQAELVQTFLKETLDEQT